MAVTWSPNYLLEGTAISGLSNGNLTFYSGSTSPSVIGSVGKKTGKWYWEYSTGTSTSADYRIGVQPATELRQIDGFVANHKAITWRGDNAIVQLGTARYSAATVGVSISNGIVGVAVDCDSGKVWFAKNNSWIMSGDPANDANPVADANTHSWWPGGLIFPAANGYVSTTGIFASGSLTYSPPNGFSALTDTNDWPGHTCHIQHADKLIVSELYGRYRIVGTVDRLGVAGPYNVKLFVRNTASCIGVTQSDANGQYVFNDIKYVANGYYAIAFDSDTGTPLNAAIADLITPELMP